MPSAFRYQNVARWTVIATVVGGAFLALYLGRLFCRPPFTMEDIASPVFMSGQDRSSTSVTGGLWMAFQARPDKRSGVTPGQIGQDRFRLAGTFFIDGAGDSQRRAILDDVVKRDQYIVSEGERLEDTMVDKIFLDHVILQTPSGMKELWVEFAVRARTVEPVTTTNQVPDQVGATNKLGCIQIQENRWKFSRKPIMDYYQELLDEPDRMVAVFDTMKPVRDEQNKITGYVVGLEGEKDFFAAVGLQQGDIVRSVNSFPMTNRRRAEAFIDQFLKDQLNAVVLEVERGGKTVKQVYQLQP